MTAMSIKLSENDTASTGWPDERLVESLRRGTQSAGDELVRRYHEPLLRFLGRMVGSDTLAEELLQQTWLSALEHLDQFRPNEGGPGFKAWLFRIATNKVNDLWRSRGREKTAHEGLRLVRDIETHDASVPTTREEDIERLRLAIEQLPEAQRQVVVMRYFGDLKFVEIAEALGCPLNTALGRMHKAMLKLKTLMNDEPR